MLKFQTLWLHNLVRAPEGDTPAAPPGATPPAGDPAPAPNSGAGDPAPTPAPSLLNKDAPPAPEPKPGDPPKEGDKPPADTAKFSALTDLTLPEGFQFDSEAQGKTFSDLATESGLSKEQAQKFLDFGISALQGDKTAGAKLWADTQTDWQKQIATDPVLGDGKDAFKPEVAKTITSALDEFAGKDAAGKPLGAQVRAAFDITGAGNNPFIVRTFFNMAKALTEAGRVVPGKPNGESGQPASIAERMYPHLMNPPQGT